MKHFAIPLFAVVVSLQVTALTYGDLGDQLFKLLPFDGEAGDRFGENVAVSGTTVIVGTSMDDDNDKDSGSAYLYDISNPTSPISLFKLLAIDGVEFDHIGGNVAISGTTAIVGAPGHDHDGPGFGSAYLFDTTTGKQVAELLLKDAAVNDNFGNSVAISATTAIVGARGVDNKGYFIGSVCVFDISDPANPTQIAKLLPDDSTKGDNFGAAVAIYGDNGEEIVIVGQPWDDDNGMKSGSVYVFVKPLDGWVNMTQTSKILPIDGAGTDSFGNAVALNGATALVAAWGDDDNGDASGSAYLFNISDPSKPTQIAKLLASDGAEYDRFGWSVAISSTIAIVGATGHDDNGSASGSAYLFDTSTGMQIDKLLPDDGTKLDHFGWSVAISDATAIISAAFDDDNGIDSGSAYLFDAPDSSVTCPWDLDKNGSVDTGDLLELFAQWGTDGPADFDESGAVGISDLLILFANWGSCL